MSSARKDLRDSRSPTSTEGATSHVSVSTPTIDALSQPARDDLEPTTLPETYLVDDTQVDLPFDDTIAPVLTDREEPLEAHPIDIERTHLSSRYERQELLGEGGMGAVYRVFDHHLMRSVALKELKSPHASSSELQRAHFIKEAQILAQLNHPGIIPIYDLHVSSPLQDSSSTLSSISPKEGHLFFTMEEFKGQTLEEMIDRAQRCQRGALAKNLKLLLTALVDIARAVAYAHSKRVIHRDLKPQNVMIGQYGRVSVLDWGLGGVEEMSDSAWRDEDASLSTGLPSSSDPALTYTGVLSGTPAYMSPEQARCEPLDESTDIYSLGAVLYQCLSSTPPYTDIHPKLNGQEIVSLLCENVEPTPIRSLSTRYHSVIPSALYTLCETAMALNSTDRFSSMEIFADEIEAIIFGEERRLFANQTRVALLDEIATHWFAELKRRQPSSQWERIQSTHSPLPFLMNRHVQSLIQINRDDPIDYESTIDRIALAFDAVIYLFNHYAHSAHSAHLPSIIKTLQDAAQLIQEQSSLLRAEGIEIDWSEIEYLTHGESLISLTCQAPQELAEWTRGTLKVTDIPTYNKDPETSNPQEVRVYWTGALTACPTLSLTWGHYQAEVTLDGRRYIQLFDVSPLRCLSLFKEGRSPLVNAVLKLRQREHEGSAPLTPFWGLIDADTDLHHSERQEISLPIAIPPSIALSFSWISRGMVRLGSALPLPNSELPSMRTLEGLWMQTTQVSCCDYIEYLNDLKRLTLILDDESIGAEWLSKEIPRIHIKVKVFYNKHLFEWSEASQCFEINEGLRELGHHETMPVTWLTLGQAFRYSLWFSWRSRTRVSLPTEAEWEKGARGIDARLFPWGHDVWDSACNHGQLTDRKAPMTKAELLDLYRYDISPYGVRGLGGGASDWTMNQNLYREVTSAQMNRELNHLVSDPFHAQDERVQFTYLINTSAWRVDAESYDLQSSPINLVHFIRGGSWVNSIEHCLTTYRFNSLNYKSYGDVSFRLVHRPQAAQGGTQ